ncbi:MAG: nucleotidyl transferase AbiEii/AbiGii toxin family protein [candidate division NC10 bacterium]|nr:nucleotidyl transferase AbiEii/AbiGii toxin family protein [candidate division NC10 bacterium]
MPIDPRVIPALTALARVLGADNRDFVLIGATVPQILLRVRQGGEASARATRDVDALVAAGSWEDFERTRRRLFEVGFGPGTVRHELLFGQDVIIDLIPYGEQLVQNDRLEWPGTDQVMSTLGVEEAFASARLEELVPGLSVRVVPIPGLVLLKIVSYQDRPEERARDLSDVVYCFEHYEEDIVQSRRFDLVGVDVIGEPVEFEEAGAYLLGTEVARLASPRSLLAARRLIDMIPDEYSRPISQILREERRMINNEGRRTELFRLFQVFAAGLSGGG